MLPGQGVAIGSTGASGWQPNQAASGTLIGWYEVRSDLVTVAAGVASQVNNRVAVGANPLIQPLSGSGQRPAYEATGWGGVAASVLFDGSAAFMTSHGLAASVTGTDVPFTVVTAMQIVTIGVVAGTNRAFWCFGNTASDNPLCGATILDGTTDGAISRRSTAGALKQRAQATALTTSRATYTHIFAGSGAAARGKLRINGVQDANLDGATSPAAELNVAGIVDLTTFSVGAAVRFTTSWLSNIRLGGMLVYAGALSNADALLAEKYLQRMHPN